LRNAERFLGRKGAARPEDRWKAFVSLLGSRGMGRREEGGKRRI